MKVILDKSPSGDYCLCKVFGPENEVNPEGKPTGVRRFLWNTRGWGGWGHKLFRTPEELVTLATAFGWNLSTLEVEDFLNEMMLTIMEDPGFFTGETPASGKET